MRRELLTSVKRVVIKVGSRVLTLEDGSLDRQVIATLCADIAALEQQAILELNTARQELQVAEQRISVTKVAISQAQENLRINQNRYQERVGTASDVLDAQTLLSQTETDNLQAVYEYQRAIARVKRSVGEL